MTLTVKIVDVQPFVQYQDTVYEYKVVVNFENTIFGVFDPDMYANPNMIGEIYDIEIAPFTPTSVELPEDINFGIIPNSEDPRGISGHTYCGEVSSISEGWPKFIDINMMPGTVTIKFYQTTPEEINYRDDLKEVSVGDMIRVTTTRTDLRRLE